MPLTPKFALSQSDDTLTLRVHLPYVRIGSMEVRASEEGRRVTVYCKPYLLNVVLPESCSGVADPEIDDRVKAKYDADDENGTVTIELPKLNQGEFFEDLDMLTKLMMPRKNPLLSMKKDAVKKSSPLIEVVSSTPSGEKDSCEENENETHTSSMAGTSSAKPFGLSVKPSYGFVQKYSGALNAICEGCPDLLDFQNPDDIPEARRRMLRHATEDRAFDQDRFLGDELDGGDDALLITAKDFVPHWLSGISFSAAHEKSTSTPPPAPSGGGFVFKSSPSPASTPSKSETSPFTFNFCSPASSGKSPVVASNGDESGLLFTFGNMSIKNEASSSTPKKSANAVQFSQEEQRTMLSLPRKEYLIKAGSDEMHMALRSILCVLLAYVYDHRMTQGDPTIESPWTVRKLSATLSWLDTCSTVRGVIDSFVHRCLCYPYMRSFSFAKMCVKDARAIFKGGRRVVLRCLLQTRKVFASSDEFYPHNRFYLDDMCVWLQTVSDEAVDTFALEVSRAASTTSMKRVRWGVTSLVSNPPPRVCDDAEGEA